MTPWTAQRLQSLPPYLFAAIDGRRRELLAEGVDVINFGIGDPDLPTPGFIVERLRAAAGESAHHRYPPFGGLPAFREAVARFMLRRYGVELDPAREVLGLIGSKEGVGHLPLAVTNPGDGVLIPEPAYPVYHAGTLFAGALPIAFALRPERGWMPDFGAIDSEVARRSKLVYVNYPNNPTGATAPDGFWPELIAFARDHELLIASDAAYNEMYFDRPAASVLQFEGARERAVEFHSCSKSFNMTGWRLGFAVGQAEVLAALGRIKANLDSGQFAAVQLAGCAAYDQYDHAEITANRAAYQRRAEALAGGLASIGFRVESPKATFYVWAGIPGGDSLTAARRALDEAQVAAIPGVGFGSAGEGYLRFAVTVDERRIAEAVARLGRIQW